MVDGSHRETLPSLREDLEALGKRVEALEGDLETWKGRWLDLHAQYSEIDKKLERMLEMQARQGTALAEHRGATPGNSVPPSWWPHNVKYRRGLVPTIVVVLGTALAVALERAASQVLP